jgi:uncharacterized protein YndB with AHSA1/START domain
MEKIYAEIIINQPVARVWDAMLEDETYRIWTAEFNPNGSWYEGKWEEGSEMLFLGPDDSSGIQGMVALVKNVVPHQFVSIEHRGMIRDGVQDTTSEAVMSFQGALENYIFTELSPEMTKLEITLDCPKEWVDMMREAWPRALKKLKDIS